MPAEYNFYWSSFGYSGVKKIISSNIFEAVKEFLQNNTEKKENINIFKIEKGRIYHNITNTKGNLHENKRKSIC